MLDLVVIEIFILLQTAYPKKHVCVYTCRCNFFLITINLKVLYLPLNSTCIGDPRTFLSIFIDIQNFEVIPQIGLHNNFFQYVFFYISFDIFSRKQALK